MALACNTYRGMTINGTKSYAKEISLSGIAIYLYKVALEIFRILHILLMLNGKKRIKPSKLEKVKDPKSLISLRNKISNLLPKIGLPELLMEVNS